MLKQVFLQMQSSNAKLEADFKKKSVINTANLGNVSSNPAPGISTRKVIQFVSFVSLSRCYLTKT